MAVPQRPAGQNKYSEQYMQNSSFDELYNVFATILLAEFSGSLKRLQSDTDGNLKVNVAVMSGGGDATAANQVTEQTLIGAVTETAPATDTASSGLNGRLQRIAQRLTSLIALLPAALGAGGGLKVDGSGTALPISVASIPSHDVTNAGTFATQATLQTGSNQIGHLEANQSVNVAQINGVATTMGNGASGTGVQRVTIANDSTGVVGLNAGTNNIGQVNVAPQTANGLSVFAATSQDGGTALTNSAQVIKASAGNLYGWYIYNPNAAATYVVLYNTAAASVTVGTTNPLFVICIPATSAANVEFTNGITFSNAGWSVAATTTGGGNAAPTTALEAVFFYK